MAFNAARLSLLAAVALSVVSSVSATESMKIPSNKNETMRIQAQQENPKVNQVSKRTMLGRQDAGKVNLAYYVNCELHYSSRQTWANSSSRGHLRWSWQLHADRHRH